MFNDNQTPATQNKYSSLNSDLNGNQPDFFQLSGSSDPQSFHSQEPVFHLNSNPCG